MYSEALLLFAKRVCDSTCETNVGNVADHVGKGENCEPRLAAGLTTRLLPSALMQEEANGDRMHLPRLSRCLASSLWIFLMIAEQFR